MTEPRVEIWGGVECTVNRVGQCYFDQLSKNGHDARADDIAMFAQLGIRRLRYPVLWERTERTRGHFEWAWADERLELLRSLGVKPIVGLLHHGSGPPWTNLLDEDFPELFAAFALAVARRYPWVDAYTPINEPLTTARFSALYGHWFPHLRDDRAFARALVNQCRASVRAMEMIRTVNARAELVQTEDLGKTHSVEALRYQAESENERRWLTWDLLSGRFDRSYSFWNWLCKVGIEERDLLWFQDHPCPPSILGINHYVTSERFLDDALGMYPLFMHGGNGAHRYVDIEAVRALAPTLAGWEGVIAEAWERYHLPIAVTEVHLGSTREEQLRWLDGAWRALQAAKRRGVDVRALTVWSLLGAYDWNVLVTSERGFYESGAFDIRSLGGIPRATAVATMMGELAYRGDFDHPVLDGEGWWERPSRAFYGDAGELPRRAARVRRSRPLAICGAGAFGQVLKRLCEARGLEYRLLEKSTLDITDARSVERMLNEAQPWALMNAAGYRRIVSAESEVEQCRRVNVDGALLLARACEEHGIRFVTFSSDLVFGGERNVPYVESDETSPLNAYGRSKVEAETLVAQSNPHALIVRSGACFGSEHREDFVRRTLRTVLAGAPIRAASDVWVSPTYVWDLLNITLDLLIDGEHGIWHLVNGDIVTWADLAFRVVSLAESSEHLVERCAITELCAAPLPLYSALVSERARLLPSLDDALARCFKEQRLPECNPLFSD